MTRGLRDMSWEWVGKVGSCGPLPTLFSTNAGGKLETKIFKTLAVNQRLAAT